MRVLLVEDNPELVSLLIKGLGQRRLLGRFRRRRSATPFTFSRP